MYFFSPSLYSNRAINAVRLGSYSIDLTSAETSNLFLLKSITLYLFLCPPPIWREVILPLLFLPPELFFGSNKLFSGLSVVIASNPLTTLKRWAGVIGFNFLTDI